MAGVLTTFSTLISLDKGICRPTLVACGVVLNEGGVIVLTPILLREIASAYRMHLKVLKHEGYRV